MANYATNLDTINESQSGKAATANAFFDAASPATLYGRRASQSSGNTWGYYGGRVTKEDGTTAEISNGTLTLTLSATNYIVAAKATGVVTASAVTTNWDDTTNYFRLYQVVCGSSLPTGWTDYREIGKMTGGSGGSGSSITVKDEGTTLTSALTSLDFAGSGVVATNTSGAVTVTIASSREVLSSNRTYYVRTDGSDSNNGLANTSGGAFLTVQKAIDVIYATLDLGGKDVTVQVADGTYTGAVLADGPFIGKGSVTINGNNSTPTNVVFSTTSSSCVTAQNGAFISCTNFKVTTTTSGVGLLASKKGHVNFSGIDFGTCATHQIRSDDFGSVTATGNYTISGGAATHFNSVSGAIRIQLRTVTLSNTPAFYIAFCQTLISGLATVNGNTYSGTGATGVRYDITTNGVVYTAGGGANYFPGNAAGTTATGGQYS